LPYSCGSTLSLHDALPICGVDDASLVGTVLNLTGLGVLDSLGNVGSDRANLGVGHQAARAQDLAQSTDDTHRVRRGDDHVEIQRSEEHTSELQSRENLVCR